VFYVPVKEYTGTPVAIKFEFRRGSNDHKTIQNGCVVRLYDHLSTWEIIMLIIKANKLYEFMILIIQYVRSLVDWHEGYGWLD
jgi:hypothetical protein